ncbi:uncharacterized membrane protein YgdD (TMEM256/DUF423 family) [Maribacter vaceletii]|uniref:Uncharacterized membrane protein YgdD (TMEM256/DUF423 family) n=1 Tax=Maribacter vaceletii TaxID=1206816 RepID=A0A495EED1_9FLAO|nr:DUF423 domain-containing protein [Maribacter vaceletii]RKR15106.1 uncharacterized membrane protein YgdD (TMEM256/DUF423 family) [Maribacter vaceletii]
MNKTIFGTGILLGVLAVILGAFGAHALEKVLSVDSLQSFETGVRYQMYHALLLLFLSTTSLIKEERKKLIYYLLTIGIIFFSFSIYLLATNSLTGFNFKTIALLTPIGGTILIFGWVVLGYRTFR